MRRSCHWSSAQPAWRRSFSSAASPSTIFVATATGSYGCSIALALSSARTAPPSACGLRPKEHRNRRAAAVVDDHAVGQLCDHAQTETRNLTGTRRVQRAVILHAHADAAVPGAEVKFEKNHARDVRLV